LKFSQILNLVLEHHHRVLTLAFAILKLAHLVHPADDFLLELNDQRLVVGLVYDFYSGHVRAVRLVKLEINIVGQ